MKVAIVHYWWLSNRGGEAVVKSLVRIYPGADLFLHVCNEDLVRETLGDEFTGRIITSFISKLPGSRNHYQKYLPLMPIALEQLDLSAYDLVISSESGPAKGVITRPDALHICYCHSPMRYLWDMYHEYLQHAGRFVRSVFPLFAHWLRVWDRSSADRVDAFIANSTFIKSRINKYYRRESRVVFPPVNTLEFSCGEPRENYYLWLGQLVGYKRPDLAIDAFNKLDLPLIVIGEGELLGKLQSAAGKSITFLGRQPSSVVKKHLECCKALIFPGTEDFGIVPVEAMAAGAPVIAYARGGILDTVIDGVTGIYFYQQTIDSLSNAVLQMESNQHAFVPETIKQHARNFDEATFRQRMSDVIDTYLMQSRRSSKS
jgi:glycosyltransferase involved in cell wall biosynthesis